VSDKIKVIDKLLDKANSMLIGGAMSYTFLAANGVSVGNSIVETDKIPVAREAMEKAKNTGVKLLLPIDHVVTTYFDPEKMSIGSVSVSDLNMVGAEIAVDIGPKTVELFKGEIASSATILWNGPMGVFEVEKSSAGTFAIAEAVAKSKAVSIIGGGDSVKAIKESGYADKVSFVSTGGGASLEFLEGIPLPGVEALMGK
jgi:3-phosphoglycerate kinase